MALSGIVKFNQKENLRLESVDKTNISQYKPRSNNSSLYALAVGSWLIALYFMGSLFGVI